MSLQSIRKRVERFEEKVGTKDDGLITLEELCRAVWRQDKSEPAIAQFSSLISQFEREETGL